MHYSTWKLKFISNNLWMIVANLSPSFFLFLLLFWMLEMLITVNKPYHVPHSSWITTSALIFTETCLGVSKEWVRFSSHAFLKTNEKTFSKNFWQSVQKKDRGVQKKRKEKNWNSNCKTFCVKHKRNKCYMITCFTFLSLWSQNIQYHTILYSCY